MSPDAAPPPAVVARPTCLLCGGAEARVVFHEFGVDIVRCRACGHVYSTHVAPADFDGFFASEDLSAGSTQQFWWGEAHRAIYDDFGRRCLAGRRGRLLDVGAGLGYFVQHVTTHFPDWEAHGCEISARAVAHATQVLGVPRMRAGRVEDAPYAPGSFDLITLWDVIEHLAEPDAMLRHLAALLAPEGRLFLHTPNIRVQLPKARLKRWLHGMQPGRSYLEATNHLHDYAPGTLRTLLRRNGLGRIRFLHLRPIQSVSGSRSPVLRLAKNTWARSAAALHRLTLGAVNLDNLFVLAGRG